MPSSASTDAAAIGRRVVGILRTTIRYTIRAAKLLDRIAQSIVGSRNMSLMEAAKEGTTAIQSEYDDRASGENADADANDRAGR